MSSRQSKGMHPEDIKAAVRKTGITLTGLALKHGLSESACRMAILFQDVPAGERAIITHLNIAPHKIWPYRYNKQGVRIIGSDKRDNNANDGSGHCQNGEAA